MSTIKKILEFLFITLPFKYLAFPAVVLAISFLLLAHYKRMGLILLHSYPSWLVDFTHNFFFSATKFLERNISLLNVDFTRQGSDLLWIGVIFITPIMVRGFSLALKMDKFIAFMWDAMGLTYVARFAADNGRGWINHIDYPLYLAGWGAALATYHFSKDPPPDKAEGFHIIYVIGCVMFVYLWLYLTELLEVL